MRVHAIARVYAHANVIIDEYLERCKPRRCAQ